MRYLDEGDEFEAEHHDESSTNNDKPWGEVIGACLIVQLVTLTGVFVSALVAVAHKQRMKNGKSGNFYQLIHKIIIPAFGAGALLATAVFLLIPESLELIGGGHDSHGGHEEHKDHEEAEAEHHEDEDHEDEDHLRYLEENDAKIESHNEASWKFGASLLGGFLLPAILHAIFPHPHFDEVEEETGGPEVPHSTESAADGETTEKLAENTEELAGDEAEDLKKEESPELEQPAAAEVQTQAKNWSLAASILVGDFFHNFADGIFIGASFHLCGSDIGWTITATTIYHEIAQEIADFALLTHHCGFKTWEALALNFVAGFSIFLGGIIVLASNITDLATGVLLAMSAGVYFYIGGAECVPRAQKAAKELKESLLLIVCIIVGAIPIGLVLLNHGHCSKHEDEHDEHEEEHEEDGEHHEEDGHF